MHRLNVTDYLKNYIFAHDEPLYIYFVNIAATVKITTEQTVERCRIRLFHTTQVCDLFLFYPISTPQKDHITRRKLIHINKNVISPLNNFSTTFINTDSYFFVI